MKFNLALLLLSLVSGNTWATRIIYGNDDRVDTYQASDPLFKMLARSSAALIHQGNIRESGNSAQLKGMALGEVFRLCDKERFFHQPVVATCSGFLVAPDIMVSAGHCFDSSDSCSAYRWVFDYKVEREKQGSVSVPTSSIYKCEKILAKKFDDTYDYAIIRLDRRVPDRSPVKIAAGLTKGSPVVMIGHPSGLPQKVAAGGIVKTITENDFTATVDAFQVNSGSGVFHAKTGDLMGILVRGGNDYETNKELSCQQPSKESDDAEGEGIASFTQFQADLDKFLE